MSSDTLERRFLQIGAVALLVLGSVTAYGQGTAEQQDPPAETEASEPSSTAPDPTASSEAPSSETQASEPESPPHVSPETEQPAPASSTSAEPEPPPQRTAPRPEQTAREVLKKRCGELNQGLAALLIKTILRVGEVNVKNLPPEIFDQRPESFQKLQEDLAGCLSRLEAAASAGGGQKAILQEAADVVTQGHKVAADALLLFEKEALQRGYLTARLEALAGVVKLPLATAEWPPPDLCAACPDLWKALGRIQRLLQEAGRGPGPPQARIGPTADSLKAIDAQRKALCDLRLSILAVTLDVLDATARYYSWTQSWQSFLEIRDRLSSSAFAEWCRP